MKTNKLTYTLIAVVLSFFLLLSSIGGYVAFAAPSGGTAFENQNVLDDLKGSTINGKLFSQSDYEASDIKNLQMINFVEYGYFSESKAYYNLYFYIYNPQELDINFSSTLNQIEFRVGGDTTTHYYKYDVQLLNTSGVLYKYKVVLNATQRSRILNTLNATERIYEIAGVELLNKGDINATDYEIATTYTYTGEGESLSCTNEGSLALTLDVHNTNYRASGSNGTNNYTQDTLHSVYFSIPDQLLAEYGEMTAVHARWLNALTKPMLVVGDKTYYDIFYNNAINNLGNSNGTKYLIWGNLRTVNQKNPYGMVKSVDYYGDWVYHSSMYISDLWAFKGTYYIEEKFDSMPIVIYADNGNASSYTVSSDKLIDYFKNYDRGNKIVAGKYSSNLFESYDTEFTEINKTADEEFKLTSQEVNQNFWEWLFGLEGSNIVSNEEFKTKAIVEVKPEHFKTTPAETSKELLIAESDYVEFKEYYDQAKANKETVYLFRYYQSEYKSEKADIMDRTDSYFMGFEVEYGFYLIDTVCDNAYLAQEEIQLDFDVIDITCTKGDVKTVIGIVATPLDNFSPVTPPLEYFINDFWKYGCVIMACLAVVFIFNKIIEKQADKQSGNDNFNDSGGRGRRYINNQRRN